ncbi:MAG: ribosome maturation factor RimM [Lachnospiraceae bacterium]|jgi:16S rRNA processing protein RimM|nr:ribosome maturation factor RimM [Lachnospiraceae bacterium]
MLRVGVVASTHGLKGEVKVYPTTDKERFLELDTVYMATGGTGVAKASGAVKSSVAGDSDGAPPGGSMHFALGAHNAVAGDSDGAFRELRIERARFFKNMAIIKFGGIDTIDDVYPLRGRDLWITRDQAAPLGPDENYIADLLGLRAVADTGEELGVVVDVLETGANDVYVVRRPEAKDLLLPAIKSCILSVDLENHVMNVHLLDGLLDL